MILDTLIIQPNEKFDYDIDCTTLFNTNNLDTVDTVSVVCEPAGLTVSGLVKDPTTVKVWIEPGAAPAGTYTVETLITSVEGRKAEAEFIVVVEEITA